MRAELHFHLLPAVDDGPKSMEESLELARLAVEDGTSLVVCTPHAHLVDLSTVPARVRELQDALDRAAVPLCVRAGGEVTPGTSLTDEQADVVAQGPPGRRWVLLEAPLEGTPGEVFHDAADELEERGFALVIAHPERSPGVLADRDALQARIDRGALLQVNASSLTGNHGAEARDAGLELVRRGDVTLLASDAHRPARPPMLSAALDVLAAEGIDGTALTDEAPLRLLKHGIEPARRAA